MNQTQRDARVVALSKMSKRQLIAEHERVLGLAIYLCTPLSQWSKDELISDIIRQLPMSDDV